MACSKSSEDATYSRNNPKKKSYAMKYVQIARNLGKQNLYNLMGEILYFLLSTMDALNS